MRPSGKPFRTDALGACILSLSLNLSFLVLFPVTVDRSISVFMLAQMAAHPDDAFTAARMRGIFEGVYLGEYRQIERRMGEQAASGNVIPVGDGYVITPQGRAFIRLSLLPVRLMILSSSSSESGITGPKSLDSVELEVSAASLIGLRAGDRT